MRIRCEDLSCRDVSQGGTRQTTLETGQVSDAASSRTPQLVDIQLMGTPHGFGDQSRQGLSKPAYAAAPRTVRNSTQLATREGTATSRPASCPTVGKTASALMGGQTYAIGVKRLPVAVAGST